MAAPAQEAPRPEKCNVDGVPTGGDSAALGIPRPVKGAPVPDRPVPDRPVPDRPVPDRRVPDWAVLRDAAANVVSRAYAPYSSLRVGAAGLCDDGYVVTGCNVENASFGLTLCAECGLVSALFAHGHNRLVAISVMAADGRPLAPCGRCRQVLMEHGGPELLVDKGPELRHSAWVTCSRVPSTAPSSKSGVDEGGLSRPALPPRGQGHDDGTPMTAPR